jgi:predicted permease
MRNIKLAFRALFRSPYVTAVAIASLALGIGANAAIFSMFQEMLLEPLPVSQPGRLVNLSSLGPKPGSNSCNQAGGCEEVFSYPMFRDLERAHTAFSGLAAHVLFGVNLAMAGRSPTSGDGLLVSGSYFPTLGIRPAVGRLLGPNDDRTIGASYLAVLSYGYWETQLGSNPAVLGQPITVNGHPMTIVGVAPRGFSGTTLGAEPRVFVPMTMRTVMTSDNAFENRRSYWAYMFARLAPGATVATATAAVNAVYRPIINDVEAPLQKGMSQQTMTKFRAKTITLEDGRRGQSSMHHEVRTPLILLFSITGIVLLIACANIANLLLARAASRSMEMAVRLSLGAARRQLVAQLLTESVVLALLGGAASLVVAHWTLDGISAMLPSDGPGSTTGFSMSATAFVFTAALSLTTGLLFGLAPALHSTRPDLVTELRNNSGKLAGGRGAARLRSGLVTAQIALSMSLLVAAGLFIKSLRNVSRVDLGIKIDNMATFSISPGLSGYDTTRAKALFERVESELGALPGTAGVTASIIQLIGGNNWGSSVSVEGFRKEPDTDAGSRFNAVGPGYFGVIGVPILAGREFTAADEDGAPRVAIVNETFAKKFGLGRNAVGKHMSVGNDSLNIEIVGLVKDSKYSEVKQKIPPVFVVPYRQNARLSDMTFYVRSALPLDQVFHGIRDVMKRLDPALPIDNLKSMPQQVRENVFLDRIISTLSAAFAALATLLAAVGLYGVLAYSVAQRTREIGVRMALGADSGRVRRMVLRQVGLLTLIGGVIGLAGAYGLGKAAGSLLFEMTGNDPAVFALSGIVLAIVAVGAGLLPAIKASRVDPMAALRYD